jgi:hypothetical protein
MANEPATMVLIHGLWMTSRSWEHWKARLEFAGRPHFPGVPGWEEVADYALAWVEATVGAGVPAGQGAS